MQSVSHTVTFHPHGKQVVVDTGTSILKAADAAGITIGSLCGGEGICGRCKMIVSSGTVTGEVSGKLTREEIRKGYVLGCLAFVHGDVVVEIPPETLARDKAHVHREMDRFRDVRSDMAEAVGVFSPLVRKVYLDLEPPSLASNLPDHQRVCAMVRHKLGVASTQTGLKVIKAMPAVLRQSGFKVTATVGLRGDWAEVMNVEPGNTEGSNYIVAVDMGTTTVVAHLIDAVKCTTLGTRACFNSQGVHGAEVTARLIAAEKIGCDELQRLLVDDINQLIAVLADENKVPLKDITAVVCAGNTVMGHFLLGLPIETIRRTPYIAASVEPPPLRAAEVGININQRGLLYSLPGVSGWVGSDLTAGILATGMHLSEEVCLLVDIGTNGEVIVGNKEWLMACSASAGPALEGASVVCGMRAESGAIERVAIEDGAITWSAINGGAPAGLCGSGIIDLIAVLLRKRIINRSGRFIDGSSPDISLFDGIKGYTLVPAQKCARGRSVYITEIDIRNVITAKAAIFAAIRILLRRLELNFSDVKQFFLAGAFGNYINIESAVAIGLVPDISRDHIVYAGNTSVQGAKMVALHREAFETIITIERNTTYYDLMGAEDYFEEFTKAQFLPHTDIETFFSLGRL